MSKTFLQMLDRAATSALVLCFVALAGFAAGAALTAAGYQADLAGATAAAWVQAVGALLAIGGAWAIARAQDRRRDRRERDEADTRAYATAIRVLPYFVSLKEATRAILDSPQHVTQGLLAGSLHGRPPWDRTILHVPERLLSLSAEMYLLRQPGQVMLRAIALCERYVDLREKAIMTPDSMEAYQNLLPLAQAAHALISVAIEDAGSLRDVLQTRMARGSEDTSSG